MPDFNKSLKKRRTTSTPPVSSCPAQTQNVTSPAPPPNDSCCSSNRGDGPSTNCSERQSAVDVSIAGKEECGSRLAQGFFGVYDGHCGSEAVQFVRDRLHAMIGEHESFVKVRLPSSACRVWNLLLLMLSSVIARSYGRT